MGIFEYLYLTLGGLAIVLMSIFIYSKMILRLTKKNVIYHLTIKLNLETWRIALQICKEIKDFLITHNISSETLCYIVLIEKSISSMGLEEKDFFPHLYSKLNDINQSISSVLLKNLSFASDRLDPVITKLNKYYDIIRKIDSDLQHHTNYLNGMKNLSDIINYLLSRSDWKGQSKKFQTDELREALENHFSVNTGPKTE